MNTHTPGPWRYEINPDCTEFRVRAQEGDVLGGCGCCGSPWCGEEDARLIAAAPELLEALKGVLRVADRKTDEFDAARAAINKATGEHP